jgi:putative inorganic carbon (HCO3(-)) transporter
VGVGAFPFLYNRYDLETAGKYGTNRAVHSAWFGVLAELGYPGLLLFLVIIASSLLACRRVRLSAKRGEVPEQLGAYAIALETALVAFIVGGSFVSFHYCEMLWHFFALTVALERAAVAEAAVSRAPREEAHPAAALAPAVESDRDFAWT